MGRDCTCVGMCACEGRAAERVAGQRGLPACTAPHSRYYPSRKVVLGLTSTVLTTPNAYFNIRNEVMHQIEGNIFLSEKQTGSGLIWRAPELQHKTRNSLLCPQRLCCAYHSCSQLPHNDVHLPSQRLGLSSGRRTKNHVRPATARGLQLRFSLRNDWN